VRKYVNHKAQFHVLDDAFDDPELLYWCPNEVIIKMDKFKQPSCATKENIRKLDNLIRASASNSKGTTNA